MRSLSRPVIRGAVGFLIGLAVWFGLSGPYTSVLAALSETAIRIFEQPAVTSIDAQGSLMVINRSDVASTAMRPAVESTDITFNFILLITLFAVSHGALTRRNAIAFLTAAAALSLVHVAATIAFVQMFYVESLEGARYGAAAQRFWGSAAYFYGIVGSYGSAVALGGLLRPSEESGERLSRSGRRLRVPQRVQG